MKKMTRRDFLRASAFAGGAPIVAEEGLGVFFGQLGSVYF